MAIKQQIKHGAIQKVCHLHNDHTLSILLYHFLCVIHLTSSRNYRMREKKIFCIYGWFSVSCCIDKGRKITSLNTIKSLDTYVFINNPHWQSSGITIFLCKFYVGISDKLVGSFLNVLFLLFAVILSVPQEKPRRKNWVTEKST